MHTLLALLLCLGCPCALAASVSLAWDASPSPQTGSDGKQYIVDGYTIWYGPAARTGDRDKFTYPSKQVITGRTTTTATIPNLPGGTRYWFSATAEGHSVDGTVPSASSLYSNEVDKVAGIPSPATSIKLSEWLLRHLIATADAATLKRFVIKWTQPSGPQAQFWIINSRTFGQPWQAQIGVASGTVLTRYVTTGQAQFVVSACNATGCSGWSEPAIYDVP